MSELASFLTRIKTSKEKNERSRLLIDNYEYIVTQNSATIEKALSLKMLNDIKLELVTIYREMYQLDPNLYRGENATKKKKAIVTILQLIVGIRRAVKDDTEISRLLLAEYDARKDMDELFEMIIQTQEDMECLKQELDEKDVKITELTNLNNQAVQEIIKIRTELNQLKDEKAELESQDSKKRKLRTEDDSESESDEEFPELENDGPLQTESMDHLESHNQISNGGDEPRSSNPQVTSILKPTNVFSTQPPNENKEIRQENNEQQKKKAAFNVKDQQGWSLVVGKKLHETVKAADKAEKICIYVGNVSKSTRKDDLTKMIQEDIKIEVTNCVELPTKRNYNSYRITIKKSDVDKALNENNWPMNLRVRLYVWPTKPEAKNGQIARRYNDRSRYNSNNESRRTRSRSRGRDRSNGRYERSYGRRDRSHSRNGYNRRRY
jgi:hypothetical protein